MEITYFNRKKIIKMAKFLEILGYKKIENEYSIEYSLNNIIISICYPPYYSEESDIGIKFIKENQYFSIGWIAFVRENIHQNSNKSMKILDLIEYLEKHYYQITDYQYCVESNKLVDEYVEENQDIFKKEVQKFLRKNG